MLTRQAALLLLDWSGKAFELPDPIGAKEQLATKVSEALENGEEVNVEKVMQFIEEVKAA